MTILRIEHNVALDDYNTFGIAARARELVRVRSAADLQALVEQPALLRPGWIVLGGGSNVVLTGDVGKLVLKMEVMGKQLVGEDDKHWIVQAGAGENWHGFVAWTLQQGWSGLENLALIPGVVGSSPVQNIGAYGIELQDRFHSLEAVDMETGRIFTLDAAQCGFGYRDSVFKHTPARAGDYGLAGKAIITHVRFALPKVWKPELDYLDLQRKMQELGLHDPTAQQVFDMVVAIRSAKLPNPAEIGNAGSFFKNPVVSQEVCDDIISREPKIVHYPMPDGTVKLAAGWMIDACGWRSKSMGNAGVYSKQALVLVNRYPETGVRATGGEVMTLAGAIQTSVYERFGIRLEPEPVVL